MLRVQVHTCGNEYYLGDFIMFIPVQDLHRLLHIVLLLLIILLRGRQNVKISQALENVENKANLYYSSVSCPPGLHITYFPQ